MQVKNALLFLSILSSTAYSQITNKGMLTSKLNKKTSITYNKFNSSPADTLFTTRYSVAIGADTSYKIIVNHNPFSKTIRVLCDDIKTGVTSYPVSSIYYQYNNSGMVFNNESNLDTALNLTKLYGYLLFFQDTARQFISLNSITTSDSSNMVLEKVSKSILNEHNKIAIGLIQNPALSKLLIRQDRMLAKRINMLEKSTSESSVTINGLKFKNSVLAEDLKNCKKTSEFSLVANDSLSNKVYNLVNFQKSYTTENKERWNKILDSVIYDHCSESYFENTDIKFVIKITTDTFGVVTNTDIIYPAAVTALSSKDNYLYSSLCTMMKKAVFTPNKIDIYGKKYSVKTAIEKDLFISIKNNKMKVLFTDKDNIVDNDTKLPLSADMKKQVNGKLYVGAKAGKYGIKVCSFTVNNLVKEIVKEMEY